MPTQSVITIFPLSMLLLWSGLWLLRKTGQKFNRRQLGYILLGGILMTTTSLLISSWRLSGTTTIREYGWPHFMSMQNQLIDTAAPGPYSPFEVHLRAGPAGSYLWVNVIFWFSVIVLIIGAGQWLRRHR